MSAARALLLLSLLLLGACTSVSPALKQEAARIIDAQQPRNIDCDRADRCAHPSPILSQAEAEPDAHRALIIDEGQDALLARLHLIRAARESIDLQTFIYDEDDVSRVILRELIGAARRGVKVRMLLDQVMAMKSTRTLAALAGVHANLEVRLYSPVLDRAYMRASDYAIGTFCCFRRLNQRMHNKLLLIDGQVGITGGRNYQDDYFDWDPDYNYRDRDLMLSGPATPAMAANFEAFWQSPRSIPVGQLRDVAELLRREGVPELSRRTYREPERARLMQAAANDTELLTRRLVEPSQTVDSAQFVADLPRKHRHDQPVAMPAAPASDELYHLIRNTQQELLMQTPYLVFSRPAQNMFADMQKGSDPPRVVISTNSLAATDAFIVYALSHKYKRRYLRRFRFEIYEYKPFPEDAPINLAATGALPELASRQPFALLGSIGQGQSDDNAAPSSEHARLLPLGSYGSGRPLPTLQHAGVRIGLHAKSMVVDGQIGVIGTHNFDPRGDNYNTESAVIIRDSAFAERLAASIRRDTSPANSWTIAPHAKFPILPGLGYSLLKVSENLPVFDLMPRRYGTSWEYQPSPDCPEPLRFDHPDFRRCYRDVGAFPQVDVGFKWFATRLFTAFGSLLAPIL